MMSISIFISSTSASTFGPSARKPVAISRSCRVGLRRRRAAGRRRAARVRNWSYGLSCVERGDDVVAVAPGVAVGDVLVQAVGVGVAGHVEPVPAPALAVVRARPAAGRRRGRRRRGDSSARNASTSSGVGGRPVRSNVARRISVRLSAAGAGRSPCASSSRQDEAIERRASPSRIADAWQRRLARRLEGPEPAAVLDVDDSLLRPRPRPALGGPLVAVGIGRPDLDPLLEVGDLLIRELLLRRHLQVAVRVPHRLNQQAIVRLARHDRRPSLSAAQNAARRVEPQSRRLLLRPMTLVALLDKQRADLLLEKGDLLSGVLLRLGGCAVAHDSNPPQSHAKVSATVRTIRSP